MGLLREQFFLYPQRGIARICAFAIFNISSTRALDVNRPSRREGQAGGTDMQKVVRVRGQTSRFRQFNVKDIEETAT